MECAWGFSMRRDNWEKHNPGKSVWHRTGDLFDPSVGIFVADSTMPLVEFCEREEVKA